MRILGSVAAVVAAVRDEVDGAIEKLERELEEQLQHLEREDETGPVSFPDREARLAAAQREARERLAREDWQDAREALEEREKWIARVVVDGQRKLAELEEIGARRKYLAELARDGLQRLPGTIFEVLVSAADAAILDDLWCREVTADIGSRTVHVAPDGLPPGGGCIVRTVDGKVSFDNSFRSRSQRFESAWRAALGEIYES